jgi:hypothetical protein
MFKPGVQSDENLIRLRQRGTFIFFCTNIWLSEPNVRAKETISSALPEAELTSGSGTA